VPGELAQVLERGLTRRQGKIGKAVAEVLHGELQAEGELVRRRHGIGQVGERARHGRG